MARRNREINIFNMSLLDILCGALGAFCFMMLALLPYYKPPGAESDIRKNQQKTDDLVKRIDEANRKMGDSPAVEDLRKLVEELKKQIQEMQGQLNQALSKIEALTKMNAALSAQNAELADHNAELGEENAKLKEMLKRMTSADALAEMKKRVEQLQQQVQQLAYKNSELAEKNSALGQRVKDRTPIIVNLRFDLTQEVDLCLEDVSGGRTPKSFDPGIRRSAPIWSDDVYLYGYGSSTYTLPESPQNAEYRVFVNLVTSPKSAVPTTVNMSIAYGPWPNVVVPELTLDPQRPWQFYGTIKKVEGGKLSFTPASTAERDAVWTKLSGRPVPQQTPSPYGTPRPRPIFPQPVSSPEPHVTPVPGQKKPWLTATPPPVSGSQTPATPVKP